MKRQLTESVRIMRELLERVPAAQDIQIKERSKQGYTVIFKERGNDTVSISVICLNRAVPSAVKEVIEKECGDIYRVITAPYISEASARICEKAGVGYCDFSGNCLIQTDFIYISSKGNPNLYPSDNHAKTIFKSSAKTTSLILRVLMKDVSKTWKIKELAETVGCSIGMVFRVKTYLCEQSWATMDSAGLHITDAEALMREWSRAYETPDSINCYTLDSISLFEEKCFKAFKEHSIRLCLSGFSGGVRYTPVVRSTKAHVWVAREDLSDFLTLTGCKRVDSGANVTVYIADSEEVFADRRVINKSSVASPVQVFLDCMQLKGRGEETAEAVLSKEICR